MKFLNLFLFMLLTTCLHAQTSPQIPPAGIEIAKAIPPSPDAASLGKYGAIPVSPYTGVPNVSIPLYTIKSGDLTLPLSLSYHAGGIKTEEMASSVGLGWTLNAGGAITRTIRGMPDEEDQGGLLSSGHYVPKIDSTLNGFGNYSNALLNTYLNKISDGSLDGEADMFNFNFGGYSGKFVMDTYGHVFTMPRQKIVFTYTVTYSPQLYINSFTAITPDGIKYIFGSNNDGNDAVEFTNTSTSNAPNTKKDYATSWFLKQIISPLGHTITFNYNKETFTQTQARTITKYQWIYDGGANTGGGPPSKPDDNYQAANVFFTVKLRTINFETGSVLIDTAERHDVLQSATSRIVKGLTISGLNYAKSYRLFYTNNNSTRLRLDSLISYAPVTNNKEKYSFYYHSDPYNNNFSYAQDYWGYYNNVGNQTLVPAEMYVFVGNPTTPVLLDGADRKSDASAMLGGTLNQIVYPTGGSTKFTFEANTESNRDLRGISADYPTFNYRTAFSNDPNSIYQNYDSNNGNPSHNMHVYSNSGASIPVSISSRGLGDYSQPNQTNFISASIKRISDNVGIYSLRNNDTTIYLPPGEYRIVLLDNKNQAYSASNPYGFMYEIIATWNNDNPGLYKNYIVGGLRIKEIVDYDGRSTDPIDLRTYRYTQPGTSYSSGWLGYMPTYTYDMDIVTQVGNNAFHNFYHVRTSVSNAPLATTQGNVVGYSHVEEFFGDRGKKEYFYTDFASNPDFQPLCVGFPFAPAASQDWHRGQLLRQITYKSIGETGLSKVEETVNNYGTSQLGNAIGIKVGFSAVPPTYSVNELYYNSNPPYGGKLEECTYSDNTDFTYLASDTIKTYDPDNNTRVATTYHTYEYDPGSLQVNRITTVNSKGEKIIKRVTYPNNYSSFFTPTGSLAGVLNLQSRNILNYPVEEVTEKSNVDGSNLRTVNAVLTTYKTTQPLKDSVYALRSTDNVYNFVNSSGGANNILKDSRYQPVISFDRYDNAGNILQEKRVSGPQTSYIWSYYNAGKPLYPVAEVINADANNIAYTNFENYLSTGDGGWAFAGTGLSTDNTAPMGVKCFNISGTATITKGGLATDKTFIVSFWAKAGGTISVSGGSAIAAVTGRTLNGWTYQQYKVSGASSVSIGGNGIIDELRLYPEGAQMTTYTYSPLIGVTGSTDAKGLTTYYEYDGLGRLQNIKDQNGNIVKNYDYHYGAQ